MNQKQCDAVAWLAVMAGVAGMVMWCIGDSRRDYGLRLAPVNPQKRLWTLSPGVVVTNDAQGRTVFINTNAAGADTWEWNTHVTIDGVTYTGKVLRAVSFQDMMETTNKDGTKR